MSLLNPVMFVFLTGALVVMSLTSVARWRPVWLALGSAVFLIPATGSLAAIEVLAAFLLWHALAIVWMQREARAFVRRCVFWGWLVGMLLAFVLVKQYVWLLDLWLPHSWTAWTVGSVGLSFIVFRQIGMAIDARDQELGVVTPVRYVTYQIAFWTFLAGPVQRYREFAEQYERWPLARPDDRTVIDGLNRMMTGFLKMFLIGHWISAYVPLVRLPEAPSVLELLVFLVAFPAQLYVNFSGYCDIMLGLAAAVGFSLPENFDHPYFARNLNDFWQRWHITLSAWLRDYLYFPLQTSLARRVGVLPAMVVATLASFAVMGAWHGNSQRFVVFGLLHGAGVVAVNLYTVGLRRALGRAALSRYRASTPARVLSSVVCQGYVALTFIPFQYEWHDVMVILARVQHVRGLW